MNTQKYIHKIESEFRGTPCIIGVISFIVVPPWRGSAYTAPSDRDFYGYTDMEWELLKFNGEPFPWLENRLTSKERDEVEQEILDNYYSNQRPDYDEDYDDDRF